MLRWFGGLAFLVAGLGCGCGKADVEAARNVEAGAGSGGRAEAPRVEAPKSPATAVSGAGPPTGAPVATGACALVTEQDVTAVLGTPVTRGGQNAAIGAGSSCGGNFFASDDANQPRMVLLVQDYSSDPALFANPDKLHLKTFSPVEEAPPGLGAEAKLFSAHKDTDTSIKTLMLKKGGKVLLLQTFFKLKPLPPQLTKAQVLDLGKRIAAKM